MTLGSSALWKEWTSLCDAYNHLFVRILCITDFLTSGFLCHNTKASQGRGSNWLALRWGGELDQIKPGTPTTLEEHFLRIQKALPQCRTRKTTTSVAMTSTASISERKLSSWTSFPRAPFLDHWVSQGGKFHNCPETHYTDCSFWSLTLVFLAAARPHFLIEISVVMTMLLYLAYHKGPLTLSGKRGCCDFLDEQIKDQRWGVTCPESHSKWGLHFSPAWALNSSHRAPRGRRRFLHLTRGSIPHLGPQP